MSRLVGETSSGTATALASLFFKFQGKPDPEFLDTIEVIADRDIIDGVLEAAELTQMTARDRKGFGGDLRRDPLPLNNLCAILKWVEEDTDPPLYRKMNEATYAKDRRVVRPFLSFMWLLVKSLERLDPFEGTTVNRGVKKDLRDQYPVGKEVTFHGFTSTTKDVGALSNPMFLGSRGDRTLFQIELTQKQARDISKYSPLPEGEVLLPPGCRFKVKGVLNGGGGLYIVQLSELPSPAWIINLCPKPDLGMKEVAEMFAKFDSDANGKISKRELTEVLSELGMGRSAVRSLLSSADKDGSGDLDYYEFVAWICGSSDSAKEVSSRLADGAARAEPARRAAASPSHGAADREPGRRAAAPRSPKHSSDEVRCTGIYTIRPPGRDGPQHQVFIDDECDGGRWILLYAYCHRGGTNPPLVEGKLPLSPTRGFSHVHVQDLGWFRKGDIAEVRFYGTTSAHSRVIHFKTANKGVCGIAWNADQTGNRDEWWEMGWTRLAGHSSVLPGRVDIIPGGPGEGFHHRPFRVHTGSGNLHWNIRRDPDRWEVDDQGGDYDNTLHQVWVRMAEGSYDRTFVTRAR